MLDAAAAAPDAVGFTPPRGSIATSSALRSPMRPDRLGLGHGSSASASPPIDGDADARPAGRRSPRAGTPAAAGPLPARRRLLGRRRRHDHADADSPNSVAVGDDRDPAPARRRRRQIDVDAEAAGIEAALGERTAKPPSEQSCADSISLSARAPRQQRAAARARAPDRARRHAAHQTVHGLAGTRCRPARRGSRPAGSRVRPSPRNAASDDRRRVLDQADDADDRRRQMARPSVSL